MATQFYMSRPRWIALVVLLASGLLFWWSVGVRLAELGSVEQVRNKQESLEFKINALRWKRDSFMTEEKISVRERFRERLLSDPDGLPGFVDRMQAAAESSGVTLGVDVGGQAHSGLVDGIFNRAITLRVIGAPYDDLMLFLNAVEHLRGEFLFEMVSADLANRGGDEAVNGTLSLTLWTVPTAVREQDSLF
ncbi:MAG TPA: hypothetical protein DCF45_12230 [Gammaproteobacteria bacterium]|nr:hypothetical protein [Gammaproteobacteria bacterium]